MCRLQLNRAFNRWTRLIERVIARPRVIARNARVTGRKSFARFPRARKREAGARLARGAARKRAGKNHARRERLARVRRVTSLSRPSQSIAAAFARPPRLPAHPDIRRASLLIRTSAAPPYAVRTSAAPPCTVRRAVPVRRGSASPPLQSTPPRAVFPASAVCASLRRPPRRSGLQSTVGKGQPQPAAVPPPLHP